MVKKNSKKILSIIPAKGHSNRLPNKNINIFCRKPLLYWTIKASKSSKFINKTLVTSDSNKVLNLAKKFKSDFIIKRPKYLSTSKASSWDVIRHSVKHLSGLGYNFDYVVMLQVTSPLRSAKHIDDCFKKMSNKDTGIVSVSKLVKPIEWVAQLNKYSSFLSFKKALLKKKSKRKVDNFIINGAIYIFKTNEIYKRNFMFKKTVKTFLMKNIVSVDIDNMLEFKIAEFIKKNQLLKKYFALEKNNYF